MPQSDNLGTVQKKGNHLFIALTALTVIGIHILFALLPNTNPIFHNAVFVILDVIGIAAWIGAAVIVYKMTFETYFTWEIILLAGATVAIIILFFAFAGPAETRALNGGV